MPQTALWQRMALALAACLAIAAAPAGQRADSTRASDLRLVPARMAPPAEAHRWQPTRGRQCLATQGIVRGEYVDRLHTDLLARDGRRYRLTLAQPCVELSYYHNFYYRPGRDGSFCAGRDHLVSRAGRICDVTAIAPLQPVAGHRPRVGGRN